MSGRPPSSAPRGSRCEAFNRRDLAAAVAGAHPAFEYHPNKDWADAGLVEPSYRGLSAYRRYVATVDEVWGGQNYLTGREVIDVGDRFVLLAQGRMRAQASGVWLNEEFGLVVTAERRPGQSACRSTTTTARRSRPWG